MWAVGGPAPSGSPQRELTGLRARQVTWRVDGHGWAQFELDGRSEEAVEVVELESDLWIWRDGVLLFRGRVTSGFDEVDENRHRVQFTAKDYRGMLAHRYVGEAGAEYVGVDQGQIAWDLIDQSQQRDGGDWGVTDGVGSTSGTLRDRTGILPGTQVLGLVESLGRVSGGFEWDISPELALRRWYPTRGTYTGVVLDWGGTIARFQRTITAEQFSSAPMATGGEGTVPVVAEAVDVDTDPRGRWELARSYPSITNQSTLDARAPWLLDQLGVLRPQHQLVFTQGRWDGPDHVWIGDTVALSLRSGRLAVDGAHRVLELGVVLDDSGRETVTAGVHAGIEPEPEEGS